MAKRKGTMLLGTPDELAEDAELAQTEAEGAEAEGAEGAEAETDAEGADAEGAEGTEAEDPEARPGAARRKNTVVMTDPDAGEAEPARPAGGRGVEWGAAPRSSDGRDTGRREAVAPPAPEGLVAPGAASDSAQRTPDPRPSSPERSSVDSLTGPRPSDYRPTRPSQQRRTTTFIELSAVTERLTMATAEKVPIGRQIALSAAGGLLLVLLVVLALVAGSAVRWVLLGLLFLVVAGFVVFGATRALPWLARRYGQRELPGGPRAWIAGGVTTMAATAALLTWGLSTATTRIAVAAFPDKRIAIPEPEPPPPPPKVVERADAKLQRGQQLRVKPGLLYVPPDFTSEDGAFDLVVHFHGNTDLVKQSVVEAKLNALVHITNLGLRSRPYKQWSQVPTAFDRLIEGAEDRAKKLGLRDAKVRRIAVSAWSAGYGALSHVLDKSRHRERIDALLITDGMHGGFRTEAEREIHPMSLAAFVEFARLAAAGDKLMVLTHSRIRTHGYASAELSASHLLGELDLEREVWTESPPEVDFPVAVQAFPADGKRWLRAETAAHRGKLHVYGYAGTTAEDHIAHLAQMSVTVLPPLRDRWK